MEPASVSALLAPPAPPSVVVRPGDVGGRGAFDVLVRDGMLVVVGDDAAVGTRTAVTPAVRAEAIAPRVPPRTVVTGPTAVWVHCGGRAPERLYVAHRAGTHRPRAWAFTTVWSGRGFAHDSTTLGGVRVTTLERTAVEVALRLPPDTALPLVEDLVGAGADLAAVTRALELRVRAVGRPRAREVLAKAAHRLAGGTASP